MCNYQRPTQDGRRESGGGKDLRMGGSWNWGTECEVTQTVNYNSEDPGVHGSDVKAGTNAQLQTTHARDRVCHLVQCNLLLLKFQHQ